MSVVCSATGQCMCICQRWVAAFHHHSFAGTARLYGSGRGVCLTCSPSCDPCILGRSAVCILKCAVMYVVLVLARGTVCAATGWMTVSHHHSFAGTARLYGSRRGVCLTCQPSVAHCSVGRTACMLPVRFVNVPCVLVVVARHTTPTP